MDSTMELYDTLSRELRTLAQAPSQSFRMYCCGPTVYGPAHIGNFRTFLIQDVLRRVLEVGGVPVMHVRNITDVDDKTIRQSMQEGISLQECTEHWTRQFHEDCEGALNMLHPHEEPRATGHIAEQIAMIEQLIARGHAYQAEDGSVYFQVSSFSEYGKLSHLDPESLQTQDATSSGERNVADEYARESVADFALWKAHKTEDGPNAWDSPWGRGRPGWHIECSAMSHRYLGEGFDLHGGGIDLCFPHHENEIAQTECATGHHPMAKHWFHSAHLMVDGRKMSKSLGNLYTLSDIMEKGYTPMALRYLLISGHYRQPLNFTLNGLQAAQKAVVRIQKSIQSLIERAGASLDEIKATLSAQTTPNPQASSPTLATWGPLEPAWKALQNDLNVPTALGELFSAFKTLEPQLPTLSAKEAQAILHPLIHFLYALGLNPLADSEVAPSEPIPESVQALAEERWEARKNKDFATSDKLRDALLEQGWKVLDRPDGYDLEKN